MKSKIEIIDSIINKLENRVSRPYIIKKLNYTLEEIQDDPNKLKSIADYLETYSEKWEDFDIITYVDENNFSFIVLLIIYLTPELGAHLKYPLVEKILNIIKKTE